MSVELHTSTTQHKELQMKVTSKQIMGDAVWYKLDTGHEASSCRNTCNFAVYTKSGNYASQLTYRKVAQVVSEWESRQKQIQD